MVDVPGFLPEERIGAALRRALCLVLPSRREGYGLVVIEEAARGTPVVVVVRDDNAAVELMENGVNGVIAKSISPTAIASGDRAHARTRPCVPHRGVGWFGRNAARVSLRSSIDSLVRSYT